MCTADVKPANLLISIEGVIKIGDFGTAAAEGKGDDGHEGDTRCERGMFIVIILMLAMIILMFILITLMFITIILMFIIGFLIIIMVSLFYSLLIITLFQYYSSLVYIIHLSSLGTWHRNCLIRPIDIRQQTSSP